MYSNKTKTLQNTMTTDELMRYLCKLNQAGGESLDKPQKRDQTKETEHNQEYGNQLETEQKEDDYIQVAS